MWVRSLWRRGVCAYGAAVCLLANYTGFGVARFYEFLMLSGVYSDCCSVLTVNVYWL